MILGAPAIKKKKKKVTDKHINKIPAIPFLRDRKNCSMWNCSSTRLRPNQILINKNSQIMCWTETSWWLRLNPSWAITFTFGKYPWEKYEPTELKWFCWGVICFPFGWLNCGFRYLTPLVSSYPILIRWRLFVCRRQQKNSWMKDRKEIITFNFQLYFWVQQLFCEWENSPWIQMKCLRLPDKVIKINTQVIFGFICTNSGSSG